MLIKPLAESFFHVFARYSGTLLHKHPANTTTFLLWALYSGLKKAHSVIFLSKNLFNTTTPWPEGGHINSVPL